jgi:hypothetical protein
VPGAEKRSGGEIHRRKKGKKNHRGARQIGEYRCLKRDILKDQDSP